MIKRYHIYLDLGISKIVLRTCWRQVSLTSEDDCTAALALINRHGQYYTLDELCQLRGFFCTASDEAWSETMEDASNVERATARRRFEKAWAAWEFIDAELDKEQEVGNEG